MTKKKQTVLCKECVGEGEATYQVGFFSMTGQCPKCDGHGTVAKPTPEEELKDKLLQ